MSLADFYKYDPEWRKTLVPYGNSSFSFRQSGSTKINIFPSSFTMMQQDCGVKTSGVNYSNIINQLPFLKIREIAQDSRVMEIGQWFEALQSGIDIGSMAADAGSFSQIGHFIKSFFQEIANMPIFNSDPGFSNGGEAAVYNVVFNFYYRMIGQTTIRTYEVPCDLRNVVQQADGLAGWDQQSGGSVSTGGKSILGKIINFVGASISTTLQPRWDPKDPDGASVSTTFCLFNDTAENAINNTKFVYTIFPGAMGLQTGIIKQAPDVFDVMVSGYMRLFMSALTVNVKYKGNVRTPSSYILGCLGNNINTNMVRIPDVYEVTLTFKSLLPNNLNNYLFFFAAGNGLNPDRTKGIAGEFSEKLKNVGQKIKEELKKGKDNNQAEQDGSSAARSV